MTTDARRVLDAATSEREFQQAVVDLARLNGWLVHFVWNSRHSPSGWPDIFAVRDSEIVVLELKTERGRVTESQRRWLLAFQTAGISARVYRPSDWDEIVAILSRGNGRRD